MSLPTWLLFVCIVGGSLLRLARAQDASESWRTSAPEPQECRLRRQEELITCRGVNTTHLVESLTRMRGEVAEGRQLGEDDVPAGDNDKLVSATVVIIEWQQENIYIIYRLLYTSHFLLTRRVAFTEEAFFVEQLNHKIETNA